LESSWLHLPNVSDRDLLAANSTHCYEALKIFAFFVAHLHWRLHRQVLAQVSRFNLLLWARRLGFKSTLMPILTQSHLLC